MQVSQSTQPQSQSGITAGGDATPVVSRFLSAPRASKNRVRGAIGAKDDNEAVSILKTDTEAQSIAQSILDEDEQSKDQSRSIMTSGPRTAPQDVLYGGV